ncbi:MAG TPA: 16S rRNA (uracil(1498)-N(3))-methyltransferase [Syntrophomonadaceae bacterium]|nr:16S rRNA (uracil(1498)-N(3))-methyltransferase [Syntrophomonadaceae bacterium]
MHRFFVHHEDIKDKQIFITDKKELKHIQKVLRLKIGDEIIVFDGAGFEYEVTIKDILPDYCLTLINKKRHLPNKSRIQLSLVQAIAKGDKMDTIVQKAVEIGVNTLYPILTEHTVVKLNDEKSHKRVKRWESIALEACKQSGRNTLLGVKPISTFAQVIENINDRPCIMLYEKEEENSFKKILRTQIVNEGEIFLIVGPEGGFSSDEVKKAQISGILLAGLGQNILRTETASIIASAFILYELGDLG